MAVANYEDTNGHLPPAFVLGPDGTPWHSWRVLILPFIEQDPLFKAYKFDEPWNGPNNSSLAAQMPKLYAFHGTEPLGTTTNYLAVMGKDTVWPGATGRKRDEIKDGTSDTILVVENNGLGVHWMEPRDLVFDAIALSYSREASSVRSLGGASCPRSTIIGGIAVDQPSGLTATLSESGSKATTVPSISS